MENSTTKPFNTANSNAMLYAVFFGRKNIFLISFEKVCKIKIKYYLCQRLVIKLI